MLTLGSSYLDNCEECDDGKLREGVTEGVGEVEELVEEGEDEDGPEEEEEPGAEEPEDGHQEADPRHRRHGNRGGIALAQVRSTEDLFL